MGEGGGVKVGCGVIVLVGCCINVAFNTFSVGVNRVDCGVIIGVVTVGLELQAAMIKEIKIIPENR